MLKPITVPIGILVPALGPSGQPAADAGTFQNIACNTSAGGSPKFGSMSWKMTANDTVPIGTFVILKPGIVLPPAAAYFAGTTAPSAKVLHAMARNHGNSYVRFVLALSLLHQGTLKNSALSPDASRYLERLAEKSLEEQKKIEAADNVDFETYRARYLAPELLRL